MRLMWSILIALIAIGLIRAYARYTDTALRQYLAFISFLEGLSRRISCYSGAIDSWCSECDDEVLRELGFIDAFFNTGSLISAFKTVERRIYIREDGTAALAEYFSAAGRGYLESEIRELEICIDRVRTDMESADAEWEKGRKVVGSATAAIALGAVIMLL